VTILHFCPRPDWQAAVVVAGEYSADTLATEGFIHCSTADLVHIPANRLLRGRTDLLLLEIDEGRLAEPPRYEPGDPSDPASPVFPHTYGSLGFGPEGRLAARRPNPWRIPVAAVVRVHEFPPGPDGTFTVPEQVARPEPVPQPGDG
jgi:uncharacterized protein (DUF952 family)